MDRDRALRRAATVVAALSVVLFVWPTPYTTHRVGAFVLRVNRLTGATSRLTRRGWIDEAPSDGASMLGWRVISDAELARRESAARAAGAAATALPEPATAVLPPPRRVHRPIALLTDEELLAIRDQKRAASAAAPVPTPDGGSVLDAAAANSGQDPYDLVLERRAAHQRALDARRTLHAAGSETEEVDGGSDAVDAEIARRGLAGTGSGR